MADNELEFVILDEEEACSECGEGSDTGYRTAAGVFFCMDCIEVLDRDEPEPE